MVVSYDLILLLIIFFSCLQNFSFIEMYRIHLLLKCTKRKSDNNIIERKRRLRSDCLSYSTH